MMHAVAPASSHDLLANAHRGRHRSVSEAYPPPPRDDHPPPVPQLPKAASYTYFPRVKGLDDASILGLKGTISEDELKDDTHSGHATSFSSSSGSSPDSEDAPQAEQMPQLRPSNSRRTSRFLSFSSKSREPSEEPKPRRSRQDSRTEAGPPHSLSPSRSLSKLRRKSWISSSQSRSGSPTKLKENQSLTQLSKNNTFPIEVNNRSNGALSIPENAKDVTPKDASEPLKARVLSKKSKRPLSSIFNSSNNQQRSVSNIPAVPQIPKSFSVQIPTSFSTDKLPSYAQQPPTPSHPPLPRNISTEKLKGVKTEPRKKDELWTVFRTLEADHRKYV